MGIAITEEHRALADSASGTAARHAPPGLARAMVDAARTDGPRPDGLDRVLPALAEAGLLGIHVPEASGGVGYGLEELAVVVEQFGRGLVPGEVVASMLALALLARDDGPAAKAWSPALAAGEATAAVGVGVTGVQASPHDDGLRLTGTAEVVLGGPDAAVVLLPVDHDGATEWVAIDRDRVEVHPLPALDATRGLARVAVDAIVGPDARCGITPDRARAITTVVLGAEATGIAEWALDTAVEYARTREQFGRPIGQFQGVKHRCAEMLVRLEQARAAVWDAARAIAEGDDDIGLATGVAAACAVEAAHGNALECIQVLGGIGFTWEHDAHLYLRRATTIRQLIGGPDTHRVDVARRAIAGERRTLHLQLEGDDADRVRADVEAFVASLDGLDDAARRARLAESGYQAPHWPAPWGRDASPIEQLVIDEVLEAGGVELPNLSIGGWILPTLISYGTPAQQEQFILPTLRGEVAWCQLFSEPGAGSDLAALQTRATRVDGGWRITGQKVWTSLAHRSDWGLLIARTNPDAPKHDGITAFLVDMRHTDGIDVRPLTEMTGNDLFNEVWFDDAFIPDDLVVGPVDGGWRAARTTLANERVAMSSGSAMGSGVEKVLEGVGGDVNGDHAVLLGRVGALVVEGQTLGILGFRTTLAQLSGVEPGASSSVRKLVGGHHARACADLRVELLGPSGATTEGAAAAATYQYLQSQCLTIAGGTTNIQLNVIAERLLGLPRDPS